MTPMKIVMFAHRLEVGGTQVNAIELAAGLRDRHGLDVTFFATPGPMAELVHSRGLRYVPAPDARLHPSPSRMRELRRLVRATQPDVVHAWDWWQCLEAYYAAHIPLKVPLVVSDMMMELTRILPKKVWTTFGTPELAQTARAAGRGKVEVLVPPVDIQANAPGAVDSGAFRRQHAGQGDVLLVTVSRLVFNMKFESLRRTIEVVQSLGAELPIKFVIVGDGPARSELQRLASVANKALGRQAVECPGALLDPRCAYDAADIVLGMGGSALRGLSFGKPVVVMGEMGFSALLDEGTAEDFHHRGFYGIGDGDIGNRQLTSQLRELAGSSTRRAQVGDFARRFVVERYSLESACDRLVALYARAAADRPAMLSIAGDALRTAAVYMGERRFLSPSRARQPIDAVR